MHKIKTYITEELKFSNQTIEEMRLNSEKFYKLISQRRSVRDFDNKSFDINIIYNAILAAGTAPNGANLQPWHFVVIKNKDIKNKIFLKNKNINIEDCYLKSHIIYLQKK